MSSTDKRIVELEFDNKQFESGVKTSLQSLDNLDKSLNNIDGKSLKGLQNALDDVSFQGIEDGVSSINDKLSAMGTFFRKIIANIADDVYDLGKKVVSSTFGQILSGGSKRAQNLEHANFMFRGIFKDDADKVASAMASANEAVLDTAYGLDEAAVVAAQLAASGVELGDDMTRALTAISGAAAMTGGEYIDLGRIFTTVAGNGRLMGEQLLQFSVRGMNVAADIAEVYGLTEAEVRELVSKGAISFDMFYNTLYEKYAQHAKKANETFAGALSNVKAALNRIGAEIMTPYYTYARDVLNSIRPVLNAFKTEMAPVFAFISDKMKAISEGVTSVLDGLFGKKWDSESQKWVSVLSDKPKKALETLANIINNILQGFWNIGVTLKDIFGGISSAFVNVFGQDILTKLEKITDVFAKITKPIKETGGEIIKFRSGLQEGIGDEDSTKVVKNLDNIRNAFEGIFTVLKFGLKIGSNFMSFVGPLLTDVIAPIGNWFLQVGLKIGGKLGEALSWFTGLFKDIKAIKLFGTTVGDVLSKVHSAIDKFTEKSVYAIEWFFDNFNELPKWIMSLWTTVKEFTSAKFPKVVEFFSSIINFFKNITDQVGKSEILNKVVDFFKRLTERVKEFVSGVKLTDILYAIAGAFIYFKDTLSDAYKFLSPIFEGLFDTLKHLASVIKDTIIGTLSGDAGRNLLSGGILATLIMIFEKLRSVLNSFSFQDLQKSVVNILDSVGGVLKSYTRTIDAQNLWTLAKAIGVLAFSIALLAMLDLQKVTSVAAVLMMLGGGLAFFIKSFSKTKEVATIGDALDNFGKTVGAGIQSFLVNVGQALSQAIKLDSILLALDMFAFAVLELAFALKIISTIDKEAVFRSLIAMSAILVLLGGMLAYIQMLSNRFSDGKAIGKFVGTAATFAIFAESFAKTMLIMSAAIAAMAATYEKYSDGFKAGIIAIIAIMTTLTVTMFAFEKMFSEDSIGKIFAFAGMFALLSGSLGILAVSMAKLAGAFALINVVDKSGGLIKGFSLLFGVVATLTAAGKIVQNCWKDILAMTAAFGIITLAMYPLIGALSLFMLIPWDSIEKFVAIMGTFTLSIGITAIALAAAGAILIKAGVNLESFAKSAALFGVGVALFGNGVLSLAASLVVLGAAAPLVEKAAAAIAAGLVAFIVVLSEAGPQLDAALQNIIRRLIDNLLNGIKEALGPTIQTLGEIIVSALDNLQKYLPDIIDKLSDLIVTALTRLSDKIPAIVDSIFTFIGALGAAIKKHVGHIDPTSFALVNLFMIELGGIIIWFNILSKQLPGAIKTIGVVAILLALIVATFGVIDALGVEKTLEVAIGISSVLIAISGAMFAASYIPVSAAVEGALGMAAFFGILAGAATVILTVLGLLNKIEGFREILESGKETLILLGEAIGGFIGSLAGGIVEGVLNGVSAGLESLGIALGAFWVSAEPFFNGIRTVDESVLKSVGLLAEVMLILGGAELIDAIAGWLVGEKDFAALKEKLVGLGDVIIAFSEKVSPLTPKDISNTLMASIAAKNLSELAANIPTSGGILKIFTGGKNMKKFSQGIDEFGDVLIAFAIKAAVIAPLGTDNMTKAIEIGERFAEFNKTIPVTQTGLWQIIAGKKDMPKFAKGMEEYANILVNFATQSLALAALNAGDAIEDAISVGERFAEFNKAIPVTQMGALQAIMGKKDMPKFAKGMEEYANILVNFALKAKVMSALDAADSMDAAIDLGFKFAEFSKSIPITQDGLFQVILGGQDMSLFATGMENFAIGVSNFYTNLEGVSFDQVDLAVASIQNIVNCLTLIDPTIAESANNFSTAMDTLSKVSIAQMVKTFEGSYQEVRSSVVSLFDGIIKTLSTYEKQFENKGTALVKSLTDGIYKQINTDSIALTVSMRNVGKDAIQGFINGGKSMMTSVYWQYWEIGKLALEAAKKALDSHSPSREFEKLGMDSDIGLANGLSQYSYLVEKSSAKVGNVALDAVSDSISKIMSMLDDDLDITPTITPVLDLSQIQNGVYGVNDLLSGVNPGTFGMVDSNVRGMYETNNALYNDANVIKAINGLESRLDNVASRIESMRVVLDNGTLVGEMAPGMDVELGNISTLTRRGVM